MSDLPHPDRCEFCAMCAVETGGVVSLCLDHQFEADQRRAAKRFYAAVAAALDDVDNHRIGPAPW
jgi:hypothetical protein